MSHSKFDVEGKRVLVIGAGRGIGKGIALAFGEAGAHPSVVGLTSRYVEGVAEEVRQMGRQSRAYVADATKGTDMDRLAQEVMAQGPLDVLVNCVGDSIIKPVATLPNGGLPGMSEEEWHGILDVNLTQAFHGCRFFGPHMLERRQGCVINISGSAAFRGAANRSCYDAAKAGVMRFTESLAQEWAPYGIRVNSIAPGHFPDPEQMSLEEYQQRQDEAGKRIPLERSGRLKEVGYLAVFLASEAAAYVTGQTWCIDGGLGIKSV